jgi:hypothetical protein
VQVYEGGEVRTLDLGIKRPLVLYAHTRSYPHDWVFRGRFGILTRSNPHQSATESPQKSPQSIAPSRTPLGRSPQ